MDFYIEKRISFRDLYSHVSPMYKAYETGIMIVYGPMHIIIFKIQLDVFKLCLMVPYIRGAFQVHSY